MKNDIKKLHLGCLLLLLVKSTFAWVQDEKLWLATNIQKSLCGSQQWNYLIYSQLRFINDTHAWQLGILEGGIGYQFSKDQVLWFGYRWTARNPTHDFSQENRLFQQYVTRLVFYGTHRLQSRTRLEEIERSNEKQISIRFRERIAIEFEPIDSIPKLHPYIFDEVFFQLNKAAYASKTFFGENRFFVGFNFYRDDKAWWEIGYMNQFVMPTPNDNDHAMYHILSVTYYIA